jgi:hypothetical protein
MKTPRTPGKGPSPTPKRSFGFAQASSLLQPSIRAVGEARGFAVTRLLTHWPEIVGQAVAAIARPVSVNYGREGFGATLTLLTTGAQAPMLDMQKDQIRDKVNACYGYRAISRVRITQTAPTGFAEGQVAFAPAPKAPPMPDPETDAKAAAVAEGVTNTELRLALTALATNVLRKQKS